MELKGKKEHVLRCIILGMDLYSSMILAECTEAEITLLEADEEFLQKVKLKQYMEEYSLLEKFNTALNFAVGKGNTKPIELKLSKLNPDRWGKKEETHAPLPLQGVTINLNGKYPEGTKDGDGD